MSRTSIWKFSAGGALAFLIGFGLTCCLKTFFSESDRALPAIAASFIANLGVLAASLAMLPDMLTAPRSRTPFIRGWLRVCCLAAAACCGLWAAAPRESLRIFAALFFLSAAQSAALFAAYALLEGLCGFRGRGPRVLSALGLTLLATALFWSREPILFASKSGGALSELAPRLSDGVMKLSPPAAVAAAWFMESDAARGAGATPARFDLVRGPMTYAVWIGSYQSVAVPGILPSGLAADFYAREDFSPGVALTLLLWALPLMLLLGLLDNAGRKK